jgi:hypothetical protein
MIAGASKARFLRPTVIWDRSPGGYQAFDSRVGLRIAAADECSSPADGEDGRSGNRLDQQIGRRVLANAAKLGSPLALDLFDALLEGCRVLDRAFAGTRKTSHPQVQARLSIFARCRSAVAGCSEAVNVVAGPGGQDQRDGRQHPGSQPSAPEHQLDERPAGPAVAIGKRVDGLELGVRDRGLGDRGQCLARAEGGQVFDQARYEFGRRRHEYRRAGVVVASPDPVLLLPQSSGELRLACSSNLRASSSRAASGRRLPPRLSRGVRGRGCGRRRRRCAGR